MEFSEVVAPFTRPAAMLAALAGIIALSLAFVAVHRAHSRLVARKAAEKRCRQLVGQMRRCPKLRRPQDRLLAEKFNVELDGIVRANAFALHEIGTSRAEIDRILYLVREEDKPNPFMKRIAPPPPRADGSGVRAIILPAGPPAQEQRVLFEATFGEADFPPPDGGPLETVDVILDIETDAPVPSARPARSRDPMRELQNVDDGELEAFIDDRFAAITKGG